MVWLQDVDMYTKCDVYSNTCFSEFFFFKNTSEDHKFDLRISFNKKIDLMDLA